MTNKPRNKVVSKGERLGWSFVNESKTVSLTSVELKGRRASPRRINEPQIKPGGVSNGFFIP